MKIQDLLFLIVILGMLILRRRSADFALLGLLCIGVSIPLFAFWIFFTAQRLIYYAACFILVGTLLALFKKQK